MITNFAHRGASGYFPENTMLAFEKAVEMNCTGIETDVQMTKDGVLVLIHDEYVNRTTNGTGLIKDFNFNKVRELDAGSYLNPNFSQCRIPTVEELITLVKDKNIIINFEIKTGIVFYENIEEKLIELIYKYKIENKVILSSFNHYSMVKCKEISKNIKTGLLYMAGLYEPEIYCQHVGADALHPFYMSINSEIVSAAHKKDLLVNPYTVNDEKVMNSMLQMGVDGIITNFPDKLDKLLE